MERYARLKQKPRRRESPSYMLETHLGGRLENTPGLDPGIAMSHGMGAKLISSIGRTMRSRSPVESVEEDASRPAIKPELHFNEETDWTLVTTTSVIPWRCICHLEVTFPDGRTAIGTGWLSGPDTVITAGHNVFFPGAGGWAKQIRIIPGRDGSFAPFGETHGRNADVLPGWISSNGSEPRFDLGVIKTNDTAVGVKTGWFGYTVLTDSDLFNSPLIHSAGYPDKSKPFATQWVDAGRVTEFSAEMLEYRIDTEEGQSGSPIFIRDQVDQRLVVAIHVYGKSSANLGLRITDPIFDAILSWTK